MAYGDTGEADALEDDDASAWLSDEGRIHRLLVSELGAEMAEAFSLARDTQQRWARRRHPHEGLRERKKRRTRQQLSDVATTLFLVRGFDSVKVSEVADIVGVSEKTVYNYFPTKESLIFDRTDEGIARLVGVLRNREPGESPTKAVLRALGEDLDELEELPDETQMLLPLFAETVAATPSLRAAWLDLQGRLVEVATEQLAAVADVDPRDPEPVIAARAIVGLYELAFAARIRHVEQGLRGRELTDAVLTDLERAARLLDTGLWSFNLLTQGARAGQQLRDAALAAAEDTKQVVNALKQARATWREIRRREQGEVKREHGELKRVARELLAAERREGKRGASPPGATVRQGTQRTKKSVREANAAAERAAYESFRQRLEERHEAIRERRAALRAAAGAKL
jgi:AcrR family transcriptional regulator